MKNTKQTAENTARKRNSLSQALFAQLPEFSFLGNEEVVIEGSKGVLEYTEELVRVNTGVYIVCFYGRGLNLRCISSTELIIDGYISKVEFVL